MRPHIQVRRSKRTLIARLRDFVSGRRAGDDDVAEVTVEVLDPRQPGMGNRVLDAELRHKFATVGDFAAVDIFMVMLATFGIRLAAAVVFGGASRLFLAGSWANEFIIDVIVLCYLLRRVRRRPSGAMLAGFRQPYEQSDWWWSLLFYLPFAPLAVLASNLNAAIIDRLFGRGRYHYYKEASSWLLEQLLGNPLLLTFLVINVVIMAPLIEEIWFRGIGLAGYRKTGSLVRAVVWTSLIFGMMHGMRGFLHASLLGVIFAVIRLRTGSLYCCMLVHGTHNLLALLWAYATL